MSRVRTHYENLKVSRDAPIEIIHAAFKTLAAKYGPGLNAGDAEATRIAMIVSRSYAVLCDPAQRAEHDKWIATAESAATEFTNSQRRSTPHYFRTKNYPRPLMQRQGFQVALGVGILCFVIGLLVVLSNHEPPVSSRGQTPVAAVPAQAQDVPEVAATTAVSRAPPLLIAKPRLRPALAPKTGPVRSEIDEVIQSHNYTQLPPAELISQSDGSGPSHLSISNDTGYALTITFYSSTERSVQINAGQSEELDITPGKYRVLCRANVPTVLPFVGNDNYSAGAGYRWTLYIKHQIVP